MNLALTRIRNELRGYNLEATPNMGVQIEVINGDLMNLKGIIKGVEGSPYEGGTYELDIKIGEMYPYKPPTVSLRSSTTLLISNFSITFVTKIWHPSVNPFDGTVCLEDVDNGVWPVTMSLYKVLLLIQSWMTTFHDKEPIDVEIMHQATQNTELFNRTAEFWAIKFAGAKKLADPKFLRKVQLLTPYAIDETFAVIALSYHNWALPNDIHDDTIQP